MQKYDRNSLTNKEQLYFIENVIKIWSFYLNKYLHEFFDKKSTYNFHFWD